MTDPRVVARSILIGDTMVGYVSRFPADGEDHVGYWIDRAYWGLVIASRALSLLLQEVPVRPLVATAATSNGASLRVLLKCGFVVERVRHSPAPAATWRARRRCWYCARPRPGSSRSIMLQHAAHRVGEPVTCHSGRQERNMVSIRVADIRDAAVLAELGRRTFHETFAAHNKPEDMDAYMTEAFTAGRIAAEIGEPRAVYLVAEAPPTVVGFARLAPEAPPACVTGRSPVRLVKLYVSADAIGSSVGTALMRAGIEWARSAGHQSLWLGVWEHNHRAKAFYERWGSPRSAPRRSASAATTRPTC